LNDLQRIVREHGPMAARTALRILGNETDAQDAVQDALVDALRLERRGTVANWGALLRHLTTCRALDLLRKRNVRPLALEPAASAATHPVALAIAAEREVQLRKALGALPGREAEVFSMRYFGGLGNGEIAATLGTTLGAVEAALSKARARLSAQMKE